MRIKLENYSKALSRGQTHMGAQQTAAIILQSQPPQNEKKKKSHRDRALHVSRNLMHQIVTGLFPNLDQQH